MTVEKSLRRLQSAVRARQPPFSSVLELAGDDGVPRFSTRYVGGAVGWLRLVRNQVDAMHAASADVAADPRFEHMKSRDVEEALWRLAADAIRDRSTRHDLRFIEEHAVEPITATCHFAIVGLTVESPVEICGAVLMPPEHAPPGPSWPDGAPVDAVIAAECRGTDGRAMMERARSACEHALRALRAVLGSERFVHDSQLRFHIGTSYWFSEGGGGWKSSPDAIRALNASADLATRVQTSPLSRLPCAGGTGVEKAAARALEWIDRAQLELTPVVKMLFACFALEALLGDRADGLKGQKIAVRRAVLGHAHSGAFAHPLRAYVLYDQVRSAAVHGEEIPDASEKDLRLFVEDVRRAISEFVEFAATRDIAKRGELLRQLDHDPAAEGIRANFLGVFPAVDQVAE